MKCMQEREHLYRRTKVGINVEDISILERDRIELLDHIIVGGTNGKMLSFREEKILNVTGRMDWER